MSTYDTCTSHHEFHHLRFSNGAATPSSTPFQPLSRDIYPPFSGYERVLAIPLPQWDRKVDTQATGVDEEPSFYFGSV